jgi:hypothetical protein
MTYAYRTWLMWSHCSNTVPRACIDFTPSKFIVAAIHLNSFWKLIHNTLPYSFQIFTGCFSICSRDLRVECLELPIRRLKSCSCFMITSHLWMVALKELVLEFHWLQVVAFKGMCLFPNDQRHSAAVSLHLIDFLGEDRLLPYYRVCSLPMCC